MKKQTRIMQSFAMFSQFGINMVVTIGMCAAVGYFLDKRLGTKFFFIVLFFVGALAGFRNIYVLACKVLNDENIKEKKHVSKKEKEGHE